MKAYRSGDYELIEGFLELVSRNNLEEQIDERLASENDAKGPVLESFF